MAPLDDLIHPFFVTFKNSLNETVPSILYPSFYTQSKSYFLGMVTEEDTLDPSFNDHPCPYLFHIDLKIIIGPSQNQWRNWFFNLFLISSKQREIFNPREVSDFSSMQCLIR
jgi:hypothetical protein